MTEGNRFFRCYGCRVDRPITESILLSKVCRFGKPSAFFPRRSLHVARASVVNGNGRRGRYCIVLNHCIWVNNRAKIHLTLRRAFGGVGFGRGRCRLLSGLGLSSKFERFGFGKHRFPCRARRCCLCRAKGFQELPGTLRGRLQVGAAVKLYCIGKRLQLPDGIIAGNSSGPESAIGLYRLEDALGVSDFLWNAQRVERRHGDRLRRIWKWTEVYGIGDDLRIFYAVRIEWWFWCRRWRCASLCRRPVCIYGGVDFCLRGVAGQDYLLPVAEANLRFV